jgi:hypothetical protein
MSKILRLPLTLLAVLAALLFLPGIASGDTLPPSAGECEAHPALAGCTQPASGGVVEETLTGDQVVDPPAEPAQEQADDESTPPQNEQSPSGPAARNAGAPAPLGVEVPELPTDPSQVCDVLPQAPICTGDNPPTTPLTCEGLAELFGLPSGCPDNFSCADLAELLGITCPEGPPTCETLAELFHLEGCPEPPTSCQEFADLLGVDNCSQIPCMDLSKVPDQAKAGLQPLLDGLEQIGIKACPAKPVSGGHQPPPAVTPPATQPPYYANCDDARAHGAAPVYRGQPGYRAALDSDNDGIGCEDDTQPAAAPVSTQPTGKLAYTGLELGPQLNVAWTLLVLGAGLLIIGRRRV